MIEQAEVCGQDVKTYPGLTQLWDKVLGLRHPVEFLPSRHRRLLEGFAAVALWYNAPKRRSPRQKDCPRRFFYAFVSR